MSNPITSLTKKEWGIWMGALLVNDHMDPESAREWKRS